MSTNLTKSQESEKLIAYYLNQQIKKVEADQQEELHKAENQRNKIKLQVWEMLCQNSRNDISNKLSTVYQKAQQSQLTLNKNKSIEFQQSTLPDNSKTGMLANQSKGQYNSRLQQHNPSLQNYINKDNEGSHSNEVNPFIMLSNLSDQSSQQASFVDVTNKQTNNQLKTSAFNKSQIQNKSQNLNQITNIDWCIDKESFTQSFKQLDSNPIIDENSKIVNKNTLLEPPFSQTNNYEASIKSINQQPNKITSQNYSYYKNSNEYEDTFEEDEEIFEDIEPINNEEEEQETNTNVQLFTSAKFSKLQQQGQQHSQDTSYHHQQNSMNSMQSNQIHDKTSTQTDGCRQSYQESRDIDDTHNKFLQFDINFNDGDYDKQKYEAIKRKKLQEMEELKQIRLNRKETPKRDLSPNLMPSASQKQFQKLNKNPFAPESKPSQKQLQAPVLVPQPVPPQQQARNYSAPRKSPVGGRIKDTAYFPTEENRCEKDRSVSYEKSKNNKKILKNAITHVLLAGDANKKERDLILQKLELADAEHYIIQFKTFGRMDFRALYGQTDAEVPYLIFSQQKCHQFMRTDMVQTFYKYDSGAKQFKPIAGNKQFTIMVDAVQLRK